MPTHIRIIRVQRLDTCPECPQPVPRCSTRFSPYCSATCRNAATRYEYDRYDHHDDEGDGT